MKKLLALVLALVMTLSLAVVGSNAAFKDADKVNETYAEAVDVLAGMKVFQGYTDGSFQPEGSITRAEVAAIVYRLYTGDVADKQASLYATYNKFNDMNGAAWAKGYIGYCANAGLVKGYDAKTFAPQDKVTGYQALAMILRAVGYDKNGEFVGADWQLHVAQTAQQLGVLKNVKGEDLNAAASRQLVAELLFQTAATVPMVNYTAALGYTNLDSILNGKTNATLGYKNFGLTKVAGTDDKWGRPAYSWTNGKTGSAEVVYATIAEKPVKTYTTEITECDVAKDVGLKADKTYKLIVNGANESTILVQRLDTVETLGAQGRLTEVYSDRIVMIDTFLAQVTGNVEAKFDRNTHMVAPYKLTLNVYDRNGGAESEVTLVDEDTAFTYAAGDFILLNAYTTEGTRVAAGTGTVAKSNVLNVGNNVANYAEIVGKADSVVGSQTVIWYNAAKHTVNGNVYNDAAEFNHNEAAETISNYTWYFDSYNNLIGSFKVATKYDYAVLTNIWWAGDPATGSGKAMGTLKYMDGSTNTVEVASVAGGTTTYAGQSDANAMKLDGKYFYVASYTKANAIADTYNSEADQWITSHLLRVETKADGAVMLTKVVDANGMYNKTGVHAQINDSVYSKSGYIGAMRVDTSTMFLTYDPSSATFNTYNGINEVPTYSKTVKVDYVIGANGVAQYVYIVGTPDSAVTKDYVLITNTGYSATLKTTANGVAFWEVNLYTMEGLVTVKTMTETVKDTLTNPANVNKLYYVTYTDGYATALREVTANAFNVDAANGIYDVLANAANLTATYKDGVLECNGSRYNVTSATVVVGNLTANMSDKIVYVIYKQFGENGIAKDAQKVYVIDTPAVAPTEPTVDTGSVTYTLNIVANSSGNAIVSPTKTVSNVAVGNYTITLTEMANLLGVSTQNLTAVGVSSVAYTVTKGANTSVVLTAYYAG